MNKETEKRLAESLTAESSDLIPYLPYLLQDFWSLSSDTDEMAGLLRAHTGFGEESRLLDLACGKGAASILLAKEFGCTAKGIDLIPAFIAEAREKAEEHGVANRCEFITGDVNEAVTTERDYDLVIWGGSGDLLGSYPKTLAGIARTINPGGYILLDDGYIPNRERNLRFHHEYLTYPQWEQVFANNNLTVAAFNEAIQEAGPEAYMDDLGNIRKRAEELTERHPDKRALFEGYVKSQQAEYQDLQDGFVPVLWLLKKDTGI